MTTPKVTILVPNYKTLDLTKLCLRLLRKHTDLQKAQVIVIDNDSQDESLNYLRTLKWVKLIERTAIPGESPAVSHSRALDLALEQVTTPYVLSIHTDTMMKRNDWLEFLLSHLENQPNVAGVGSWKLEAKPFSRRLAKSVERTIQSFIYKLLGKTDHALEGQGKNYYYLRSHCALYRMDLIKQLNLTFSENEECAGKVMHKRLIDAGYKMLFLPSETLGQYLDHLNHATMVLNPQLGAREKTITKGLKRIQRELQKLNADQILQDASLDS